MNSRIRKHVTFALVFATASFGSLGAVLADDSIDWEQDYQLDGGLVGMRKDFVAGKGCDGGFTRSTYSTRMVSGEGNCAVTGWVSDDPSDCRVKVHLGESAFHGGRCHVTVYEHQGAAPPPSRYFTTILRIDHKRWNQNPLGPGCKNDDVVQFQIPDGATLNSITIGENGCTASGPDMPPGKYVDTHVALGIVAGGTVLNSRPSNGAQGAQQLSYHWWFNQWGHSQASICVNVVSSKPLALDPSKTVRTVHVNMDDGWVKHRVNLPVCFREAGVTLDLNGAINGQGLSYKDVGGWVNVVHSDNCVVEWFGCKDDKGTLH